MADAASRMPPERSSAASTGASPLGGDHDAASGICHDHDGGEGEDQRREGHRGLRADELQDQRRHGGGEAHHAGDQTELRVGLHQLARRCARGSARARSCHGVRLRQDEGGEGEREQQARPSRWVIMKTLTTALPAAQATTMARRPPAIRSMAGPTSGATMANGSIVNSR